MRQVALYYPYISPPDPWIKSSLLLFDSISSLVPVESNLSDTLTWLQGEDLWMPSYPVRTSSYLEEIEDALLTLAYLREENPHETPWEGLVSIDLGKLTYGVEKAVRGLRLDIDVGGPRSELYVPEDVGAVILAIAAQHVAKNSNSDYTDLRLVTSTDMPRSMFHAFGSHQERRHPTRWLPAKRRFDDPYRCLEFLLDGMLPIPGPTSSIADVVDFRRRYSDEVLNFRVTLDDMVMRVAQSEFPLDTLRTCREQMEVAVRALRAAAKGRVKFAFGSLIILATTVGIGRSMDSETAQWVFDGFGVSSVAAALGSRSIRKRAASSPFSFLVRAEDQFGNPGVRLSPRARSSTRRSTD